MSLLFLALVTLPPLPYQWRELPLDGGGAIQCLAASPRRTGPLLAGAEFGGIQRSVDGGRSWRTVNRGLETDADLAIAGLLFHPTDPNLVYAATGSCFGRPRGDWGGLFASEDGGITWTERSRVVRFAGQGDVRQRGGVLAIDPFQPERLWAATAWDGVMVSGDRGHTWASLGLAGRPLVAFQRTADGSLYAAAAARPDEPGGLYLSPGGDSGWRCVYQGSVRDIATAPSQPRRVLIAAADAGLMLSEDSGANWVNVTPAGFHERLTAHSVAFSPTHPEVGVATGIERWSRGRHPDLYLTLDGGRTWSPMTSDPPDNVEVRLWWANASWFGFRPQSLAFDPLTPRRLWVGDAYNIWGTLDGAASWTSGHRGLRTGVVRRIALDPSDPNRAWLGLAEIGAFLAEAAPPAVSAMGQNATQIGSVDGLVARREPVGTVVYLSHGRSLWRQRELGSWSAGGGEAPGVLGDLLVLPGGAILAEVAGHPLQITWDGGESWSRWSEDRASAALRLPVLLDPAGRRMMAADRQGGVHLSGDNGRTWTDAGADLPETTIAGRRGKHVQRLAGQPGGAPVVYATTALGVWRTRSLGQLWERVDPRPARALAVESVTGRVYLARSPTWRDTFAAELVASDDEGETWRRIDQAWPVHRQVNVLVPDPRVPGRLWVGTAGNAAVVGEPR